MHALRSIQMNYCILFSILCFYFTLPIILIHSHESPLSLYFILFYFQLLMPLFTMWHSTFSSASRLCMCTNILVGANSLATWWAFPSTCCDSFASTTPMHLLLLDPGLPNAFPHVVSGVETWAAYDLIGKSWARTRYMRSEPCNTLSLSSVLDHHQGVNYLDYFLKLSKLPLQVHPSQTSQASLIPTGYGPHIDMFPACHW